MVGARRAGAGVGGWWPVALVACGLVACGGGDGDGSVPPPDGGTPPPAVVKVEIVQQQGALLTPGTRTTFTARALDASGNAVSGAVVAWTTNKPTVAVDAGGVVTAGASLGSALVTASAGGVTSAPVMVAVAQPAAGARLVSDGEVAVAPAVIDAATTTGRVGSRYTVTLAGSAPAVGQLLVPTGAQPVAGRVVAVTPVASGSALTVEVVPLLDLFDALSIDETVPLASLVPTYGAGAPVATRTLADGRIQQDFVATIPAGTRDGRAVKRQPAKAGAKRKGSGRLEAGSPLLHSFEFGPLECEASVATLSLDTSQLNVSIVNTVSASVLVVKQAGVTTHVRIGTSGDLGLTAAGPIELRAQIDGKLTCELEFVKLRIPVPPPVAAVAIPTIPIGVKLEAEGALKAPAISFDIKGSATRPVVLGIDVMPQVPTVESLSNPGNEQLQFALGVDPKLKDSPADWTLAASLDAGLYAKLAITNPLILLAHAAFDTPEELALFELFAGERLEAEWNRLEWQMAHPGADSASAYRDRLLVAIGVADDVPSLLRWFGVTLDNELPELKIEGPGQTSPTGLGQISLTSFTQGDQVTLRAVLDADSLRHTDPFAYASTPVYNVVRVEFWRLGVDGIAGTKLGEVTRAAASAASGKAEPDVYTLAWRTDSADSTRDRYWAVVVPVFFSSFPLRVSEMTGWTGVKESGNNELDGIDALVVAPGSGKVYGIAHTFGASTFDNVTYDTHGGLDVVVFEWSPEGRLLRLLYVGSSADDLAYQAKLGADGALYLAGTTVGVGMIGDQPSLGVPMSAWAARVDLGDGSQPMRLAWARQFADNRQYERGTGLALGPNGEVYLAGSISVPGTVGGDAFGVTCGDVTAKGNLDCGDLVLTRLDAAGNVVWRVRDTQPGWQTSARVNVGADGKVWVNGQTLCDVHTESTVCEPNATKDANGRVQRYSGMVGVWLYGADGLGGALNTLRSDTAAQAKQPMSGPCGTVSATGLLLAGTANGSVDGSGVTRGADVQLMQLDAIGQVAWSRLYGSAGDDAGLGACLLAKPDASGWWLAYGTGGWLPESLSAAYGGGAHDVALLSLDATGLPLWARELGGAGDDVPYAVASDDRGGVYVAGRSTGQVTDANVFAGGTDFFVAKYSQMGGLLQKASLQQPRRAPAIAKTSAKATDSARKPQRVDLR